MTMTATEARVAAEDALRKGDAQRARVLLEGALADPGADAALWLTLARARAALGDDAGASAAIDGALGVSPNDLSALVAKADRLVASGEARAAASYYAAALRYGPNFGKLPSVQQQELVRAKAANEKLAKEFEDYLRARLEQQGFLSAGAPARFTHAVDILVGKKRPYVQAPRQFYYPELPQVQFYPREAFAWLDAIEAAYADVRAELEVLLEGPAFDPYLKRDPTRPHSGQAGLLENPAWGAKFLLKDGQPQPAARQCPHAMAAMAHAPAPKIAGRTPHALFSKLAGGARIPPHTGMINARLICHLPLIVPEGCVFRVGNDIRPWVEGRCWVFDDTIEHEAWNISSRDRYVLIFDVWRPELNEHEQLSIAALCEAVDAFGGVSAPWNA
jgi:tetratricopeptide (TPR) repeat protein